MPKITINIPDDICHDNIDRDDLILNYSEIIDLIIKAILENKKGTENER